jgi:membrane protein
VGALRSSIDTAVRAAKGFVADDAPGLAQQIAFTSLLAFFPFGLFLVGLLGLAGAYDELRAFLAPVAPEDVLSTVDTLARETAGGSLTALVVGAVGAIWAAGSAMATVVKAVNRAYGCEEERGLVRLRLVALGLVLLAGAALVAVIVAVVFGGPLGQALAERLGLSSAYELTWSIVRWPVAFAAVVLVLAIVYRIAPSRPPAWRTIAPGALTAGVAWLVLSAGFALYTSFADTYSRTYGSIASGVVLLLWLWLSALALLYGAELNAEVERVRESSPNRASSPDAGRTGRRASPSSA